jgi:uncharacterized protein
MRKISMLMMVLLQLCVACSAPLRDGDESYKRGDYLAALRVWRPLADKGNAEAQYKIGVMYRQGLGVAQNDQEANRWTRLAANQNHVQAQYNLGVMYGNGQGVQQDYVRAYMWWSLASNAGDAGAIKNRDLIAKEMTPQQINRARRMAENCQMRDLRECDYTWTR